MATADFDATRMLPVPEERPAKENGSVDGKILRPRKKFPIAKLRNDPYRGARTAIATRSSNRRYSKRSYSLRAKVRSSRRIEDSDPSRIPCRPHPSPTTKISHIYTCAHALVCVCVCNALKSYFPIRFRPPPLLTITFVQHRTST